MFCQTVMKLLRGYVFTQRQDGRTSVSISVSNSYTVSVTVSAFFRLVLCERNPINVRISFRFQTLSASCERGLRLLSASIAKKYGYIHLRHGKMKTLYASGFSSDLEL